MLLDAVAAPVSVAQVVPGERAALEAFRDEHLAGRRLRGSVRIRRSVGAVAAGVGMFLTSGTAFAAATGVLPDSAQHLAHAWFESVGISVPDARGFIERGGATDHRSAERPSEGRPSVSPRSVEEISSLRPADDGSGNPAPRRDADDPGSRAEQDQGSASATNFQPSPEPAGNGGTQSATPATLTSPGAEPATPSADPHATPPADPEATPPPASQGDQSRGNSQDQQRDPSASAVPAPPGAVPPESPPAYQLDRHPPSEKSTQRRTR
jgi:hypothetical protein